MNNKYYVNNKPTNEYEFYSILNAYCVNNKQLMRYYKDLKNGFTLCFKNHSFKIN